MVTKGKGDDSKKQKKKGTTKGGSSNSKQKQNQKQGEPKTPKNKVVCKHCMEEFYGKTCPVCGGTDTEKLNKDDVPISIISESVNPDSNSNSNSGLKMAEEEEPPGNGNEKNPPGRGITRYSVRWS